MEWPVGRKPVWPGYFFDGKLYRRTLVAMVEEVPILKGCDLMGVKERLRGTAKRRGVGMHAKVEGKELVFQAILRGSEGGAG
jgi:hypothetical protein